MAKLSLLSDNMKQTAVETGVITSFGNGGAESLYLKSLLQGKTDSQQKSVRRSLRNDMKTVLAIYKSMKISGKSQKQIDEFIKDYYNKAKNIYINPANFFASNVQGVDEKYMKLFSSEVAKYMKSIEK